MLRPNHFLRIVSRVILCASVCVYVCVCVSVCVCRFEHFRLTTRFKVVVYRVDSFSFFFFPSESALFRRRRRANGDAGTMPFFPFLFFLAPPTSTGGF